MTERLIVIGGGGAGTAAATIARRLAPQLKVTLFTEFPDIAYSPCGIPFVHGREIDKFERLFLSTVERYVEDGLDMRMETTVTDLDLDRGTVTAKNTHEGFDKLVIGTGFTWEKPDVPGANLEGLHYVKDIRAAMLFDEQLDGMKRVAVIGATPLGVEMAGNLGRRGLEVDFVDEGPWVLSEVLDPDVAEPVHESLEKRGVRLRMGTRVEEFTGKGGRVTTVRTSAGDLECDAVIVCLHKLPASDLGERAGLKLGTTGAVLVDERMRTSAPNVWAAEPMEAAAVGSARCRAASRRPRPGATAAAEAAATRATRSGRAATRCIAACGEPARPTSRRRATSGRTHHPRRPWARAAAAATSR